MKITEEKGSQTELETDIIISLILAVNLLNQIFKKFILKGKHSSDTLTLNIFLCASAFLEN